MRRHDYYSVDATLAELMVAGVRVGRSALRWFMQRLRIADALMCPGDQTVVVLVGRQTGATHTFISEHTAA